MVIIGGSPGDGFYSNRTVTQPASGSPGAFPYDVRYLDTYNGAITISINVPNTIAHKFSYSITAPGGGTIVAGPFDYTFSGVSGWQDLPAVGVANANDYYGFTITPESSFDNTFSSYFGGNAHITVFTATTPTASQTSPANGANTDSLTPAFAFAFSDNDPTPWGTFFAYQLQVQRVSDSSSFWDTGTVNTTSAQQTAKAISGLTYAGTTLVQGTAYRWRARVQNGVGTWSSYSFWSTFTPLGGPLLPTVVLPTGLQTTLTPTIGMTFHSGSGSLNMADWQYEIQQNATTIYSSGDITASKTDGQTVTQTYGTANSADTPSTPPTLTWGTAYSVRTRAKDTAGNYSPWTAWQAFNTESVPLAPTLVSPNGSTTSDTTPQYVGKHNSPEGVDLTSLKIWAQTAAGTVVTGYNPKTVLLADLDSYDTDTGIWKHTSTQTLTDSPATTYNWWAETEADTGPGYSPASTHGTFTVSPGPTIAITNITSGDTWTTSTLAVTHSIAAAAGSTLVSRRTKLYKADGTTLIEDSGDVSISGTTDTGTYTFTAKVTNNSSYYVQSSVTDSNGQTVTTDLIPFSTSFTPPDTLTNLSVQMLGGDPPSDRSQIAQLPGVLVGWDTVDPYSDFLHYQVYRQAVGDADWTALGTVTNIGIGSYIDYLCQFGVTYNYNVTQVEDDGSGGDLESDMVDPDAQVTVTFGAAGFLHAWDNPGNYCETPLSGRKLARKGANSFFQPYDSDVPIAHVGNTRQRSVDVTISLAWLSGYKDKAAAIRNMQDVQIDDGSTLVYRDVRGEVMYCVIDDSYNQSDSNNNMASVTLTLTETQAPEE